MPNNKTYSYQIEIFPLADIHPTEHHQASHAQALRRKIEISGLWTHPLLIDRHKNALMDGHHRYHAACALGLGSVPVIRLDYADPAIELQSWRPAEKFTPQRIWDLCDSGDLLPQKSTRHIIHVPLPFSRVPLDQLADTRHVGDLIQPAVPHPSRIQVLSPDYHAFGVRMGMRTESAATLGLETAQTVVPHGHLRQMLESDPAMAALLPAAPCYIALGQQGDFPFKLNTWEVLRLPPSLLTSPAAIAAAARWGMETAFALKARDKSPARLTALLRHGARLIKRLSVADRALVLSDLPEDIAGELLSSDLTPASEELLAWISGLLGDPGGAETQTTPTDALPSSLEQPVEQVLVSNGDSRLVVPAGAQKNKYGTTPRPRPEAVHFSSSTASSISDYGFLFCDVLRRDLLNHIQSGNGNVHSAHADLSEAIIDELREICGLTAAQADGAIAASGTDTEILAVLLARAAGKPDQPLVNILISPEETGRGVKMAGAGRYFDPLSATGAEIEMNAEIWPGAPIDVVNIDIRTPAGMPRDAADLDAEFLAAGQAALARGARVLAHVLIGSKTGLSGPTDAAVDQLVAMAPDQVDVVVDACQMRVDFAWLGDKLRAGWMVQLSGSKSLTGPPFSGAILFPPAWRDRRAACHDLMRPGIGYAEDWSAEWVTALPASTTSPAFGSGFRWLPALLELKLLNHVPRALREHVLERFRSEVVSRLSSSAFLQPLAQAQDSIPDGGNKDRFARHSIMAFQVLGQHWDGQRLALNEPECRRIFDLLNSDARSVLPDLEPGKQAILSQEFHIGQPVSLGQGTDQKAVLRLVVGMRFFNIIAHAGPDSIAVALESEISDLIRAIDKLELLARNWWKLQSAPT